MSDWEITEVKEGRVLIRRASNKRKVFIFRKLRRKISTSVLEFRIPNELVVMSEKFSKKQGVDSTLFFTLSI